MTKYVVTEEEYKEIVAMRGQTQSSRLDRHLAVLQYRYEGMTLAQIGERLGYSENTVSKLVRKFKLHGLQEYVVDRHYRLLSDEEECEVLHELLKQSDRRFLCTKDVKRALEAKLGDKTPTSYVYDVMHRHGVEVKRATE